MAPWLWLCAWKKRQLFPGSYSWKGCLRCAPLPMAGLLEAVNRSKLINQSHHDYTNINTYWTIQKYLCTTDFWSSVEIGGPHKKNKYSPNSKLNCGDGYWKWEYFQNLWMRGISNPALFCLLEKVQHSNSMGQYPAHLSSQVYWLQILGCCIIDQLLSAFQDMTHLLVCVYRKNNNIQNHDSMRAIISSMVNHLTFTRRI